MNYFKAITNNNFKSIDFYVEIDVQKLKEIQSLQKRSDPQQSQSLLFILEVLISFSILHFDIVPEKIKLKI